MHPPKIAADFLGPRRAGRRAVVVLSGGQDSFVTALLAKEWCDEVHAVHFAYGQRHAVEADCAARIAADLQLASFEALDLGVIKQVGNSALVEGTTIAAKHGRAAHLPASFVPGRNILFLTAAAMVAFRVRASELWTGVCQTDYSGYTDCREDFLGSMQTTLRHALDQSNADTALRIVAPLLKLSKAETFMLAAERGRLDMLLEHTHTCYEGDRAHRNAWGYGCGACPACLLRVKGFEEFKALARTPSTALLMKRMQDAGFTHDEVAEAVGLRVAYFTAHTAGGAT